MINQIQIQNNKSLSKNQLLDIIRNKLLQLNCGFAFVSKKHRLKFEDSYRLIDLVFYHRFLRCFVLIKFKKSVIDHQDIEQMNLYLNYFKKEEATEGDNEPIGIILGAYKDQVLVEYALDSINNQMFLSKYQLYLPDKDLLEAELRKIIED